MLCYTEDGNIVYTDESIYGLLDHVDSLYKEYNPDPKPEILVYYHNLTYDSVFIFKT